MATYTGTIPAGMGRISLGVTMGASEYPTKIAFSQNGEEQIQFWHSSSSNGEVSIYIEDTSGNNSQNIGSASGAGYFYFKCSGGITLSKKTGLYGKTIAINFYDRWDTTTHPSSTSFTLTTAVDKFSVTVGTATGGTASASPTSNISPGTQVTMTATPNSGYYLAGWTTSPNVTVTNNKFTMPASNVTITPVFAQTVRTVSYYDGTQFVKCQVYYYTSNQWKLCRPYYRTGSTWKECSTT